MPTAELPSVADTEVPVRPDAASDTGPAIEEPSARELGLEAKWRLREWGLEYTINWQQDAEGAIRLCPRDVTCDPATAGYLDLRSLRDAIDSIAASERGREESVRNSLRAGVPDTLSPLERNIDIRDIDRMFWALTELELFFGGERYGDRWQLLGLGPAQAEAEVAWLARRYGLGHAGRLSRDWREDGYAELFGPELEPPDEDLIFGVFTRRSGERYVCGLDAPPGTYCCYVYCDQIDGDDGMAEGH
ncbi:MAG: hypothetical protein KC431_29295 [Myxococcales bacterium]|nr:hypothetical protein [Myxococcales bacterium]